MLTEYSNNMVREASSCSASHWISSLLCDTSPIIVFKRTSQWARRIYVNTLKPNSCQH